MIEIDQDGARDAVPTVADVTEDDVAFYLDPHAKDVPELQPNAWLASEIARLEAIIGGDDPRSGALARADLAIRLASSDPVRAHDLATTALAVAEKLSEPRVLGTAHCCLGWALWHKDSNDLRTPTNHALEAEYQFHDLGLSEWEALSMTLRMHLMWFSGSEATAIGMEPEILQLLRSPGTDQDGFVRLSCLTRLNSTAAMLAGHVKQDPLLEQKHLALAVAYSRAAHQPLFIALAHQRAAWSGRAAKQYAAAKIHLDRANLIAIRHRSEFHQLLAMQLLASIHTEEMDFVPAEDVIAEAESLLDRTTDDRPLARLLVGFRKTQLRIAQGRWDEAEQMLDELAPQTERSIRPNIKVMLETYIQIYRAKGTLHEHLDVYDRLLQEVQRSADERVTAQRQAADDNRDSEIRKKQQRSDSLLKGILPPSAYAEVVESGESEPRYYPRAVVFLSDFADFTKIAAALTPRQVIEELSDLFANFDSIMDHNGCERIETIGDAYLAVAGLNPDTSEDEFQKSANRMALAALAVQEYLRERNRKADDLGGSQFVARIGIHSGPIIGGIVGRGRVRYGIFGDAVNTAQRLEAACTPGEICVSEALRSLLCDAAEPRFQLTPSGEISPKGKGTINVWSLSP